MSRLDRAENNSVLTVSVCIEAVLDRRPTAERWRLVVSTPASERATLIVRNDSSVADIDWREGAWYRLEDVLVLQFPGKTELNATARTTAAEIDAPTDDEGAGRETTTPPAQYCGFSWSQDETHGRPHCCVRPTWREFDRCIWHADTDIEKPLSELTAARESETNRKHNHRPRELLCGAVLPERSMTDELFTGVDFSGADLRESDFTDVYFGYATFDGADLRETDFTDSTVSSASFRDADLGGADMSGLSLYGTDFTRADLTGVDVTDAKLSAATLTGANLDPSVLSDAECLSDLEPGTVVSETVPEGEIRLPESDIRPFLAAHNTDSTGVSETVRELGARLGRIFADVPWFDSFSWAGEPGSPAVESTGSDGSGYVRLGVSHRAYRHHGGPAEGLRFEFSIGGRTTDRVVDRPVVCGVSLPPAADESVRDTVGEQLRTHADHVAAFVREQESYALVTADGTWESPTPEQVADCAGAIGEGLWITTGWTVDDICTSLYLDRRIARCFVATLPVYAWLSGLDDGDLSGAAASVVERVDGLDAPVAPDGTNELAELYESFRYLGVLLDHVGDGSGPVEEYRERIAELISEYGSEQADRNPFTMDDYRERFGDGEFVTEFGSVAVAPPPAQSDADLDGREDALVRPVTPESDEPLPVSLSSRAALSEAVSSLEEFPDPADAAGGPLPEQTGSTETGDSTGADGETESGGDTTGTDGETSTGGDTAGAPVAAGADGDATGAAEKTSDSGDSTEADGEPDAGGDTTGTNGETSTSGDTTEAAGETDVGGDTTGANGGSKTGGEPESAESGRSDDGRRSYRVEDADAVLLRRATNSLAAIAAASEGDIDVPAELLTSYLDSDDPVVRRNALRTLVEIARAEPERVDPNTLEIDSLLTDTSEISALTVELVGQIGSRAELDTTALL